MIEAGIEPDTVCGTSMGIFVGAAFVTGRLNELRQWAEAATWREADGLLDVRLAGGGLTSRQPFYESGAGQARGQLRRDLIGGLIALAVVGYVASQWKKFD